MSILKPGVYEHECPQCHSVFSFVVPREPALKSEVEERARMSECAREHYAAASLAASAERDRLVAELDRIRESRTRLACEVEKLKAERNEVVLQVLGALK
jgi:hypothetical protein